jgi:hypothetical protein
MARATDRWAVGLLLGLAWLLSACQGPPELPRTAAPPRDLLAEARAAMDRREYERAAGLLRDAIATSPDSLEAHYRLAVSASHLELADEATREFQWVVAHATPGSAESQIARNWLRGATAATRPPAQEMPAPNPDLASISGVVLGEPAGRPLTRHQIFLKGLAGTPTQNEYHSLRTDQEGRYRFVNVLPGDYMLTDTVAAPPTWRLRVSLKRGDPLALDLTSENSTPTRNDFPDPR